MANFSGNREANDLEGGSEDDIIAGNAGNDSILGGGGNDFILGNSGNDFIRGNKGNDILYGGSGDDEIRGGFGDDFISGDKGNDVLFGYDGVDTFSFNIRKGDFKDGADTVLDYELGIDTLALQGGDVANVTATQVGSDVVFEYNGVVMVTLLDNTYTGDVNDYFMA